MTEVPSHKELFPEIERLVFRCLCANEQPLPVTLTQWDVRYSKKAKVSHYRHIPYGNSTRTEIETVNSFPQEIMRNPEDFIMLRFTGDRPEVVTLIDMKKYPGMALDSALSAGYGLSHMQDYSLYHAQPLGYTPTGKHSELFGTEPPPQEYFVVMKKSAYQELAMEMLIKLASKKDEASLWQWREGNPLRGQYAKPTSHCRSVINRILDNAQLTPGQMQQVIGIVGEKGNYQLGSALRDIAREREATYAQKEKQRRAGPDGPAGGTTRSGP